MMLYLPTREAAVKRWRKIWREQRQGFRLKLPLEYEKFAAWLCHARYYGIIKEEDQAAFEQFLARVFTNFLKASIPQHHIIRDYPSDAVKRLEQGCAAVRALIHRSVLRHEDRLTIAQLYHSLPSGPERIHAIMSGQSNYDERKTQAAIDNAQRKKIKPPSCLTMADKGYCREEHKRECKDG